MIFRLQNSHTPCLNGVNTKERKRGVKVKTDRERIKRTIFDFHYAFSRTSSFCFVVVIMSQVDKTSLNLAHPALHLSVL